MNIPVRLLRLRRTVQVLVLAGLCVLPWANAQGWNMVMGNFYALYAGGVPLADPLSVVQNLATGFVPGWKLWAGAGLVLVSALVLGRIFCGWICPYGLLSELVWRLRGSKQARLRNGWAWGFRAGVAAAGLAATAWAGIPLLNALSAPGTISLLPLLGRAGWEIVELCAAFVTVVLGLDAVAGTRWWCRYICPQALLLMVAAGLGRRGGAGVRVRWTAGKCSCKGEEPCAARCSVGLRPRYKDGPPAAHCVQCGDCVVACACRGKALFLGMKNRKE